MDNCNQILYGASLEWGLSTLGFEADWTRTVSMATDSFHRVIIGTLFLFGSSFLVVTRATILSRMSSNFVQNHSQTAEQAAFERLDHIIRQTQRLYF